MTSTRPWTWMMIIIMFRASTTMDPECNRLLMNERIQEMETAVELVYVFEDFDSKAILKNSPQLILHFSDDLQAFSSIGAQDQLSSLSSWLVEVETSLEECHLRRLAEWASTITHFTFLSSA